MKNVEELTGNINLSETREYSEVRKGYTYFQDGDIIFAKITPCMENGKTAIAAGLKNRVGFGSTEFHVVRVADPISRKFYFLYLIQADFRNNAKCKMKGTAGQLRVPVAYLENILTPLPPIKEQKRIVSKIESIFAQIDGTRTRLEVASRMLNKLRSSVLRQAFEGKLVPQDPDDEPAEAILKRIRRASEKELVFERDNLPKGWIKTTIDNVCLIILGRSPPSSTYNQDKVGLPFFQGKADFGTFHPTTRNWCTNPETFAEKNDILISVRAPVGPTDICLEKCCIGRGLHRRV